MLLSLPPRSSNVCVPDPALEVFIGVPLYVAETENVVDVTGLVALGGTT